MKRVAVRFHGELLDVLPRGNREAISARFEETASVKDMLESLGVPHTEIDLIIANDTSVGWSYLPADGDQITVYPWNISAPGIPLIHLQPPAQAETHFILDQHLGRLAGYLRMLGFDTLYRNDYHDDELARVSCADNRTLLTRDVGLLKRSIVARGYFVRQTDPERQVVEVLQRFELSGQVRPFRRCIRCNGLVQPVSKEAIADRLPPITRQQFDEFRMCDSCGNIFWKGSHFQHMQAFINRVAPRAAL